MDKSLVSIIVPCYNQGQYLDECLQSVVNQNYLRWECIIVNDGSNDDTAKIAGKWVDMDIRFKYIYQDNGGVCKARNTGAAIAAGFYLLPLDADDYISENYISGAVDNITITSSKVVFGRAFFFGEKQEEFFLENKIEVHDLLEYNKIHCAGLFRKQDFIALGGYDENMKFGFEDWEFWINLLKDGGAATRLENVFLFYRIKEDSRSTEINTDEFKTTQMRDYILKKHIFSYGYNTVFEMYNRIQKLEYTIKHPENLYSTRRLFLALLKKIVTKIKRV